MGQRVAASESRSPRDVQLIAELDGVRVGLGRLVDLGFSGGHPQIPGDDGVELGGIFTESEVRGRGVGSAMVRALLAHACTGIHAAVTTWCVPFAPLSDWYIGFGMERVQPPWPAKIAAKVDDCRARGLWPVDVLRVIPLRSRA